MILGSHNSWTYLKPRKWWMYLINWTAKCQKVDILTQYNEHGVRAFDLRIRFDDASTITVAHGLVSYKTDEQTLMNQLKTLNLLGGVVIRVIHEIRNEKQHTNDRIEKFQQFCQQLVFDYPGIKFYCGKNLWNGVVDYDFGVEVNVEEKCASVLYWKKMPSLFPWLFAKRRNKRIREEGSNADIMMIDFVDIY